MRACVLACSVLAALAAAPLTAGSNVGSGLLLRSGPLGRSGAGRVGPMLHKLSNSKERGDDELASSTTSGFFYCGDSLKRPTKLAALRGGAPVEGGGEKLSIVFVSAEVAPWSVTGGLGAVCISFFHYIPHDSIFAQLVKSWDEIMKL